MLLPSTVAAMLVGNTIIIHMPKHCSCMPEHCTCTCPHSQVILTVSSFMVHKGISLCTRTGRYIFLQVSYFNYMFSSLAPFKSELNNRHG